MSLDLFIQHLNALLFVTVCSTRILDVLITKNMRSKWGCVALTCFVLGYLGLHETRVLLNPWVKHQYSYKTFIWGVWPIFRFTQLCHIVGCTFHFIPLSAIRYRGFLKWGFPQIIINHPFLYGLSLIKHLLWGTPLTMETPICPYYDPIWFHIINHS